jgi:hypothetical protein
MRLITPTNARSLIIRKLAMTKPSSPIPREAVRAGSAWANGDNHMMGEGSRSEMAEAKRSKSRARGKRLNSAYFVRGSY